MWSVADIVHFARRIDVSLETLLNSCAFMGLKTPCVSLAIRVRSVAGIKQVNFQWPRVIQESENVRLIAHIDACMDFSRPPTGFVQDVCPLQLF